MSTMIKEPRTSTGSSGMATGALSGAAQGAAAGTAIMPGIGTIIGAGIGAVLGGIGGNKQDKAKKYAQQASKWATIIKTREAAIQRRDVVRQFRIARAGSMVGIGNEEGGYRSSAPQGALFGLQAQYAFNMNFFDAQIYSQRKYQENVDKSGKYAAQANNIMATTAAVAQGVSSFGSFSPSAPRGYSGLGPETLRTTNGLNSPMTQNFGWIEAPQASFNWIGPR